MKKVFNTMKFTIIKLSWNDRVKGSNYKVSQCLTVI